MKPSWTSSAHAANGVGKGSTLAELLDWYGKADPRPARVPCNPKSIGASFTRACRLRGLHDLHFHDLRHEATSRLFERGYDIPEVAQFTLHEFLDDLEALHPPPARAGAGEGPTCISQPTGATSLTYIRH